MIATRSAALAEHEFFAFVLGHLRQPEAAAPDRRAALVPDAPAPAPRLGWLRRHAAASAATPFKLITADLLSRG